LPLPGLFSDQEPDIAWVVDRGGEQPGFLRWMLNAALPRPSSRAITLPSVGVMSRSKPELPNEAQASPVTKAIIYRNVDCKAWEQIVKEH